MEVVSDYMKQRFSGYLTFGHVGDTPDVKFIQVVEKGEVLRVHFHEDEKITIAEVKERYFEISELKPQEKEKVQFLNPVSNMFVNPQSIVSACAEVFQETPLVIQQVEEKAPQIFQAPVIQSPVKPQGVRRYVGPDTTIQIRRLDQEVVKLEVKLTWLVKELVEIVCEKEVISAGEFFLAYNGAKLKEGRTLQSYGIREGNTLEMVRIVKVGCFSRGTLITLAGGQKKEISEVSKDDIVLSYDWMAQQWKQDRVLSTFKTDTRHSIRITLEDDRSVMCTPDHKFYCKDGTWKSRQKSEATRLEVGDWLLHQSSKYLRIKDISNVLLNKLEQYYHLSTATYHNFVADGFLVHNMTIDLQASTGDKYSVSIESNDKIETVRRKIYEQTGVAVLSNQLTCAGKPLQDNKSLSDYNLQGAYILTIDFGAANPAFSNKKLVIKVSRRLYQQYFYNNVRTLTFKELIEAAVNNPHSYASLLYRSKIIKSSAVVSDYHAQFSADPVVTLVLVPVEKLQFYKQLPAHPDLRKSISRLNPNEKQEVSERSAKLKDYKEICEPITMYSCDSLYRELNYYLRELKLESSLQTTDEWKVQFSNCLIKALDRLPNYIGNVHRGMGNFKMIQHEGDVICWKSFTSTSINESTALSFASSTGTVFHIQSLTGKEITQFSKYANEKQILFTPFTYFIIDRIDKQPGKYEEVWLREMPSPVSWRNNMLLWVDDSPKNNLSLIGKILKTGNAQVLQLTSTDMAEKWMKEFGWVLVWTDVHIKVISDMVRVQKTVNNYYAGVDLLKVFFDDYGYTTPILIYCSSVQRGKQNAAQRKVGKDRLFDITTEDDVVLKFGSF